MTKIYMMKMSIYVAIAAESVIDAYERAGLSLLRDVVSDCSDEVIDVELQQEIVSVDQLSQYDWDEMCIPYGDSDGNTRLKELLLD